MSSKNSNKSVLKRLLPYFSPYLGQIGIVMLTMLVVTAVHLIRPMILRSIIDTAIPQKDVEMALKLAGFFILCLLVGAATLYARVKIMARIGAEMVAGIKSKLFAHIL